MKRDLFYVWFIPLLWRSKRGQEPFLFLSDGWELDMTVHRATPEELEPMIRPVVSFGRCSAWTFRMTCRYCRDLGVISVSRHALESAKELRKAAKKFVRQGWWFDEEPVCPQCYKWKYTD